MTITYPVQLPEDLFGQFAFNEVNTVAVNASAFTGRRNKQVYSGGQYWRLRVAFVRMNRDEAEDIGAILSSLKGAEGTCTIVEVMNSVPRGAAALDPGTPTVNGGGQVGSVLEIKDAPVSVTDYLVRGDRIQVGPNTRPRLYKVLENVTTDVAGTASITVWPTLRSTEVIDDDPIFILSPKGWFEMEGNNFEYLEDAPGLYTIRVEFVEAELP